jgi:hypothetical protein
MRTRGFELALFVLVLQRLLVSLLYFTRQQRC